MYETNYDIVCTIFFFRKYIYKFRSAYKLILNYASRGFDLLHYIGYYCQLDLP